MSDYVLAYDLIQRALRDIEAGNAPLPGQVIDWLNQLYLDLVNERLREDRDQERAAEDAP